MMRLAAAALAVLVVAVWALAVAYSAPAWITWGNCTVAVIALASLGTLRTSDVAGFAIWPLAAMVLLVMWLFGLGSSATRPFAWLDLLLGIGFVAITGAAIAEPYLLRRHVRPAREAYRT
jgi:hypothetical protein